MTYCDIMMLNLIIKVKFPPLDKTLHAVNVIAT